MIRKKTFTAMCLLAAMILGISHASAVEKSNADPKQQLPDPDAKSSSRVRPVKVFIMMGQSNVLGYGHVGPETEKGTLEYYIKKEKKYPYLLDAKGDWKPRNDVWCVQVTSGSHKGWLQPGFGNRRNYIGPELGFGYMVGDAIDQEVLVIKTAVGNRALGWDIMPPSSRTIMPKDHPNQWYQGYQLDAYIKDVGRVLNNMKQYYPSYQGQGYEVAGFVWWQGHKDQSTPDHVLKPPYNISYPDTYEKNLVNLIKDLRKEFKVPNAPFVLATIAFDGNKLGGGGLTVANAQLAVSGEKGKYPQFKGNVKTIEARPYWRAREVSPSDAGYHYNHNAGTYMDVGVDLGRAMTELLVK
ncbi:MAG: sialate O-acetylesterase [Phycisphaerae bacterium]|nr:sialate O-acetylesterase [Phycisphaerae bacterium]